MFMPNDGGYGGPPQGGGAFDIQGRLAQLPPEIRAQVMARMGMPQGGGGMQAGMPDQGMNQTGPMPPQGGGMQPGLPPQGLQSGPPQGPPRQGPQGPPPPAAAPGSGPIAGRSQVVPVTGTPTARPMGQGIMPGGMMGGQLPPGLGGRPEVPGFDSGFGGGPMGSGRPMPGGVRRDGSVAPPWEDGQADPISGHRLFMGPNTPGAPQGGGIKNPLAAGPGNTLTTMPAPVSGGAPNTPRPVRRSNRDIMAGGPPAPTVGVPHPGPGGGPQTGPPGHPGPLGGPIVDQAPPSTGGVMNEAPPVQAGPNPRPGPQGGPTVRPRPRPRPRGGSTSEGRPSMGGNYGRK